MKRILYFILKKDMIRKLSEKHGEQFIDDVMNTFGIPTNLMDKIQGNKVPDPNYKASMELFLKSLMLHKKQLETDLKNQNEDIKLISERNENVKKELIVLGNRIVEATAELAGLEDQSRT